ncbi:hypothetical protein CEXT_740501 [Caerostris extrusa]|uniref:Uncharacterized protein n=1 Tax=Caerostris extrusa TaxID=172846 RepID=A0AAV4YDL2_CAEEX|nr:hypothetical protein CEXT_740501 [Caerostris extrusa]
MKCIKQFSSQYSSVYLEILTNVYDAYRSLNMTTNKYNSLFSFCIDNGKKTKETNKTQFGPSVNKIYPKPITKINKLETSSHFLISITLTTTDEKDASINEKIFGNWREKLKQKLTIASLNKTPGPTPSHHPL